ncbi:MAG TPA: serine/threonine-protein kinase [Kofleriaceae bacterium]|nr:serine/threonine-protein kinase [Kofleriaceae bacterium]
MGTRLGRYDILRTLFKGELTDLLLARSDGVEGFQRHVAIKRLHATPARDKSCVEAFVSEARLSAALHHHNIVQVLDIGEDNGQPYFAMELVHGVDLRALLNKLSKRNEQVPLQHVVAIVAAAAAALHHAHEQKGPDGKPLGIVHRDVTPANILVGFDGNVKVVDFGIAKAATKRIITDQGVLKGRVPYMAPEQCAGKTIDRRSDVFSLGVVAFELTTVRRLFKGTTEFLTMSAIVNAEIPNPSRFRGDVPPELEQILLKALSRDPADRYQSAGDMAMALDSVAVKVGVGASTTQLANYLKLQFGTVKEPWQTDRVDFDPEETTDVDFDGEAAGLAPPPKESVKNNAIPRSIAATQSSPIAQVRNIITPSKAADPIDEVSKAARPTLPAPKVAPKKAPVPLDKSYSMATEVEAVSYEKQTKGPVIEEPASDSEIIPTEPAAKLKTSVASPPPPPPTVSTTGPRIPTGTDSTEIVAPLPIDMPMERPVYKRSASGVMPVAKHATSSKRILYIAAGLAVVVLVAGTVVLWPSGVPASAGTREEDRQIVELPKAQHKQEQPTQTSSGPGLNATMADYEQAKAEQAAADQAKADEAAKGEQANPDQATAEEAAENAELDKAEQAKAEAAAQAEIERAKAEQAKAEKQAKAEQAAAAKQAKADEAKAKAEQAKAEKQAKAEQAKADKQAKAEQAKAKRTTKTTTKPTTKRTATTKKTKKDPNWNPDELFLGD